MDYFGDLRNCKLTTIENIPPPIKNLNASRYEFAVTSVNQLLGKGLSRTVFDIGAGDGGLQRQVEEAGGVWHGFDLCPSSCNIIKWDLTRSCPSPGEEAGIVLLLDVIEHLVNPGLALKHIFQVLQPNGRLVLTTPNPSWSRSRVHALLHGTPICFTQSDLLINGHFFTPWPHILMKMLRDTGFELESYVTLDGKTSWPRKPLTLRYPLRCARSVVNMLIEYFDIAACGMSYGLIARAQK